MKLNLLFIVMDLLTLLAYPIVYADGRLRQFAKTKEDIHLANLLVTDSSPAGHMTERKIMNLRKKGKYAYSND